jgi:hypothetical protein
MRSDQNSADPGTPDPSRSVFIPRVFRIGGSIIRGSPTEEGAANSPRTFVPRSRLEGTGAANVPQQSQPGPQLEPQSSSLPNRTAQYED